MKRGSLWNTIRRGRYDLRQTAPFRIHHLNLRRLVRDRGSIRQRLLRCDFELSRVRVRRTLHGNLRPHLPGNRQTQPCK